MHIPVAVGLIGPDGRDVHLRLDGEAAAGKSTTRVLQLRNERQTFRFVDVHEKPVASVLRNFSAPVELHHPRSREEWAFLLAHDEDAFCRWDAGQELAQRMLLDMVRVVQAGESHKLRLDDSFFEGFRRVLSDPSLDGSLKALALVLPDEKIVAQRMDVVDPDALHQAREFAAGELARLLRDDFLRIPQDNDIQEPYRNDQPAIQRRRLKNLALSYLARLEDDEARARVVGQYDGADNMTDLQSALSCIANMDVSERTRVIEGFHARFAADPLVLDKWFRVQALASLPGALDRVIELSRHDDFNRRNPNRVRALVGAFATLNQVRFHDPSGRGYRFVADEVLTLNSINPQVAARIVSAFNEWRRFDEGRRQRMRSELERIAGHEGLSKDVSEIVGRALSGT